MVDAELEVEAVPRDGAEDLCIFTKPGFAADEEINTALSVSTLRRSLTLGLHD